MVSVRVEIGEEGSDALAAELWEAGTLGIVEGDGSLEAFFDDAASAARFGEPREAPATDWVQVTQDAWPPLLVGEKFFVVAPWRTEPTPPGRFRLEINPGTQCGKAFVGTESAAEQDNADFWIAAAQSGDVGPDVGVVLVEPYEQQHLIMR